MKLGIYIIGWKCEQYEHAEFLLFPYRIAKGGNWVGEDKTVKMLIFSYLKYFNIWNSYKFQNI